MKKIISVLLTIVSILTCFTFNTFAVEPVAVYTNSEISVLSANETSTSTSADTKATGLILSYSLSISKNGTTLKIMAETYCATSVVKCGFRDLTVERRKSSSDSWSTYYEYGNVYIDDNSHDITTSLAVESGYYYRVTCTHYAKKNILSTQKVYNETGSLYI